MTDQHTPDGWKLVPVEPTPDWIANLSGKGLRIGKLESAIEDMLAAAPTPPAAAQPAASSEPECSVCGGFGEVSGESPGVACQACSGTGKAAPVAAQARPHPSGNAGEFKTDDQLGGLLAAIQNYGSWKYAEAKGRTEPDLSDVRAAWDDVYEKVQALAAQASGQDDYITSLRQRIAELLDTNRRQQVQIRTLEARAPGQAQPFAPPYISAMGEAAEAYIKRVAPYAHRLPFTVRWQDLYEAMLAAAPVAAQAPRPCTCHPDDRPRGPCREKYAASECQAPAAAGDALGADPLQGAADWLVEALAKPRPTEIAARLLIGYNRASRLYDAAMQRTSDGGAA